MNKNSVLTIRVPNQLKHKIELISEKQGLSINQFALYAFTKEVTEMESYEYFQKEIGSKSKKEIFEDFDMVMKKLQFEKDSPVWDKLPE